MTSSQVSQNCEEVFFCRSASNASKMGATLATLAIVLIMTVTVIDVITRSVSDRSVPGMIETAEIILVTAAFLGLGFAQRMKTHVSTSVFIDALPSSASRYLRQAGTIVLALYAAGAAAISAQRAWFAFRGGEVAFLLVEVLRDLRRSPRAQTNRPD